jgi:hypothetical protein
MIINSKDYKFIEARVMLNMPSPDLVQLIFSVDGGTNHVVSLGFEKAKEFYTNWKTHKDVYIELCRDLGVDQDLIPENIDNVDGVKSQGLIEAEQMYVTFVRSLGLTGVVGTSELEALCMQMYNSGDQNLINQSLMISAKALALINNITQNGGTWFGITWEEA